MGIFGTHSYVKRDPDMILVCSQETPGDYDTLVCPKVGNNFIDLSREKRLKKTYFTQETPGVCDTLASPNEETNIVALCTVETETRNQPSYQETPGVCDTLGSLSSKKLINLKVSPEEDMGNDNYGHWINNPLYKPRSRPNMPLNVEVQSTLYKRIGESII